MALATLVLGVTLLVLLRLSQRALPFLQPGDTYRWPADFVPLALWLAIASSLGGAVYLGAAALLRLDEMGTVLARVRELMVQFGRGDSPPHL